jgi:MoCo/4Fe-4S cofactor protein with predicted Tat translocation signal
MEKKYWKGVEELSNDAEFVRLKNNEFFENLPIDELINKKSEDNTLTPRRDFLKFLGFGVAAASLAACEAPVRKTIPYLIRPDQITPGIANYYASSYFDGYDYSSIVVKTREGRPIKIEGNTLSSYNKGKVNARVQAAVLSLYDNARLRWPVMDGKSARWPAVDKAITDKLSAISSKGGKIRILSSTVISPTTKKVIAEFAAKYPNTKHIQYDAVSCSALRQANMDTFGVNGIPSYHFEKANVIVSFAADFVANWISPVEFAAQYAQTRKLDNGKKEMSRHYQIETAHR